VLELGSGVGIGGIAAALQQPESVTLSDVDGPDAPLLLENLRANAAANRVAAATRALDWHDCLQEQGAPEEVYDVVLASDCIYYPSDAAALAAALRRHLRPGGIAVLFNRVGREGDPAGAFLQTLRELELGPVIDELGKCDPIIWRYEGSRSSASATAGGRQSARGPTQLPQPTATERD